MSMNAKPMFGPCDSYKLEPFEYPWAWEMAREQENNNWSPEEIQVGGDVSDYKGQDTDPRHIHLFESVMAQLTTFDIERGDDAAETFLRALQPAELKHFMKRLVWDEALHTRSYRYVIENLGIGLEIYDRWKEVPAMKKRVEMAQDISYHVEEHLNNGTILTEKGLQAMFRSMFFWFLIFEGVWFWISLLGPIQQLSRLGKFRGAAEQFLYIARDEAQHIRFGVNLIREFIRQFPDSMTPELWATINWDTHKAMDLEAEYINYCLNDGPILGYSAIDHMQTANFFVNMRFRSIGMPELYPGSEHRFPWMSEQMELKKETNFFEKRVTEYQGGGALVFEETEDTIEVVVDWAMGLDEAARTG